MRRASHRSVLTALTIVSCLYANAGAERTTQPPFKAGANFVRVDVYPTRSGVPIDDLTAQDFLVAEDGKPQTIETFEHIVIQPAASEERIDPQSPSLANAQAADPHRRVFVIFLDTGNTGILGSHAIKEPLIELLTKLLGPDDLVGLMTPEMSPDQITFARKTEMIEEGLRKNWAWGRKNSSQRTDQERKYDECFPARQGADGLSDKAREMIERYRERVAFDSFHDLILHMSAIREGRTAVLVVTEGWRLFGPSSSLVSSRNDPSGIPDPTPGKPPPVGVGPGGTLTTNESNNQTMNALYQECQRDLMDLAAMDNATYFRDILGEANRANVSFYPIDPRGLPAADSDMGPEWPLPLEVDRVRLRIRGESLQMLAGNTDGIAFVGNNNLRVQMRRLAADLTSYYLIGYSSTNTKLDGGLRRISVKVKRPGVSVRARSSYRAANATELAAARKTEPPSETQPSALATELGALERDKRTQPSDSGTRSTDVPGEPIFFRRGALTGNRLQRATNRQFSRTEQLHVEMLPGSASSWIGALLDRNGKTLPVAVRTGERVDSATGQRWLTADLTLAPLGAGEYAIELTTRREGQDQKIVRAIRVGQ
jgi:VWFA-related protein